MGRPSPASAAALWRAPVHSDSRVALPIGAARYLRRDNPVLAELRHRYARLTTALANHSMWSNEHRPSDIDLAYFRGNNPYLWQCRDLRESAGRRYRHYADYLRGLDSRGLFGRTTEDGMFGCWTFRPPDHPMLSRDLLDSINEIYFLDRSCGLLDRKKVNIVDIGAGYGRLGHRMAQTVAGLDRYYCLDAVPESTFVSRYYLRYRRVTAKTRVVPLDALDRAFAGTSLDIAVNVHSFSEMPRSTIHAWVDWLAGHRVRHLLVVPNDRDKLLSMEADGARLDVAAVLTAAGYFRAHSEPIVLDPEVREATGRNDYFLLFEFVS